MKKALFISIGFIAASMLVTSTCMASTFNHLEVAMHCKKASEQLEHLTYSYNGHNAPCVENVMLSATYMKAAADSLFRVKTPEALMHLNFASMELNTLYAAPQCLYFAPKIKPYLTTITQLKVEIEMLDSNVSTTLSGQK